MPGPSRAQAISKLNQLPINQAAGKLLPPDWRDPSNLNVLSLALWGITEEGMFGDLEYMVLRLNEMDPERAMQFVTESDSGDERFGDLPLNLESAAQVVLEAIGDGIDAAS